jgi:hypothetical protein
MKSKKIPKHEVTLFCDDIREELNGKVSLIGLYARDIIIHKDLPIKLSKLCFFTSVSEGSGEFDVSHTLINPDKKNILNEKIKQNIFLSPEQPGYIVLNVVPVHIEKKGQYVYKIYIDDKLFHSTIFNVKVEKKKG